MDLQLRTTLMVGRFTGCFPVGSLKNLAFSLRNVIFYYSLLPLIFYTGSEVCVLVAHQSEIASAPLSKVIMEYLIRVSNCASCTALRLWNLWSCGSLAAVIVQTMNLKSEATCKKGSYIWRYYVLGYIILAIYIIPPGILICEYLFNAADEGDMKELTQDFGFIQLSSWAGVLVFFLTRLIFILAVYFAMAITVSIGVDLLHAYENFCYNLQKLYCIEAVANVHIIHDDDEQDIDLDDENEPHESENRTDEETDPKMPTPFEEIWSTSTTKHQGKGKPDEIVFVNSHGPAFPLKKDLWVTATAAQRLQHSEGALSMKELSESFLTIQKTFDDYNYVAGPMLFALISHATISLIHKLFAIASSEFSSLTDTHEMIEFACKSLIAFLMIASLAHLGEIIIVKMRKWKEQLKCIMLTELLCDKSHDSTNTLTESVVKWEWELSAMSLFNINHALLPAIAGTMVTYLIVIIQLKVSETAAATTAPSTPMPSSAVASG